MKKIDKIGEAAMLEQAAEDSVRFANACLLASRYIRGENPIESNEDYIKSNVFEEAARLLISLNELNILDDDSTIYWIKKYK